MMNFNENDLIKLDCFEIAGDNCYWLFYNFDGNDGNGQIVEVCFDKDIVLLANGNEDNFWDFILSTSKQYLYDYGENGFNAYVKDMLEWGNDSDVRRNGMNENTMNWLINWAEME